MTKQRKHEEGVNVVNNNNNNNNNRTLFDMDK